ncbi:ABC transporter substrate-binding protein [Bacillus sp. FJAT-27264]|uniref:extracellular solute-binding protein n=1 Tax=Paenibacillus sp. (strain DSM 101736 / FJAT-27264) TaxID=1850362 RepID=UPI0008080223|nr:extracellular solute-binding protein [Bacillus sp. FJAT-27264]OBZ14921.1 ABC transporter substrate-binding protein [Bacillus sp. FJAT-27264]
MNYGKRGLITMLAAMTALTVSLSACSGSNQSEEPTNSPSGTEATEAPKDGKIVSSPLTLTYYVQGLGNAAPGIKTHNDIAAYQETEKKTGIHIDFQSPTTGQEKNQFNLLMSSGSYPDVIEWGWNDYPGGGVGAMNSGVIIPLNDYIDKYAPNLTKLLADHPEIKKEVSTDDGRIYAFPFLRADPYLRTYFGLGIRQDWLDKLGLQVPTTIDEWHTVLKALKEGDPNGNGKADEIPLLIKKDTMLNFSNVFLNAWGITSQFYLKDGKVAYGNIQPEYKEFLETMRNWYAEGLIDRDYAATDDKQKDAKWTGGLLAASELAVGGGIGKYMTAMSEKDPGFNIVGAPYPTLKKGDKPVLGQITPIFNSVGAAITSSNKHIEETVKWLDYKYGEEGSMLFNFGIEGKSYEMKDGFPTYTDDIMKNPDGMAFATALGRYAIPFGGPFVQDKRYQEQNVALPQQKDALSTWMNVENGDWLPTLSLTNDESARLAAIMTDVTTYRDEMFDKFVMGVEPIGNFNTFLKTIEGMGIQEAIDIQQAAYERYLKR